ncbi:MAG TPA: hypothetical protein VMD53_04975 [Rhizomicrobium sp.]|nr:hypothetical protein [Rhizomicrobium sp.]
MTYRNMLLAAASATALAAFGSAPVCAEPANGAPDANGKPCYGELDGAHQCMPLGSRSSTAEHPYRDGGQSDGRLNGPGKGFGRKARDLVYIGVPGGTSDDSASGVATGEGLIVLDVKANFAFVKRIHLQNLPAPIVPEEVSGMSADPTTNMIYVSTRGHLIAMDLATEKIVWDNTYKPGTCCERGQITPDGLTLEVGSDLKDFHYVIDTWTGKVKGIIPTPQSMFNHNMGMSADGKTVFDAPNGITMTVADMATMKPTHTITFDDHIRVFVINHDATRVYANLNNLDGFEIADANTGKILKRIEVPGELWKAKWADPNLHFFGHGAPQHGLAMTPDESEIWSPDDVNDMVWIYDNTGEWPVLDKAKSFKVDHAVGWITMGLDGRLAFMSSGDVVDVKTHTIVGKLKDEYGHLVHSEKFLEMAFDPNGHLLRTVNQFSEGVPAAYEARIAAAKQAAK